MTLINKEYTNLKKILGPLIVVEGVEGAGYGEMVEIALKGHPLRHGRVLQVDEQRAVIEVYQGTINIAKKNCKVHFKGKPMVVRVSKEMLGRMFNGMGEPTDGMPSPMDGDQRDINGLPLNPICRTYPRDYIETGISIIDLMTTLIRGQKLPIFSGNGLPHNKLVAQIIRQANISEQGNENFAIVLAAMGLKNNEAEFFKQNFETMGAAKNVAMFLNLADDPSIERLVTPRVALTAAEYLAFDLGMHVLVILTDMANYAEALREVSSAREEVPSRKGYPGYFYSDLASLYERAGRIKGHKGSITQLPILSMPNDDITHPIPDLTGFITEGQIILERELTVRNVYPPVNVFPSLSRLMKNGIGKGMTRDDHPALASQLYAAYSHVKNIRSLVQVIGEDEISELDKCYLHFGEILEKKLINQGYYEKRTMEETLDLAWQVLSILPEEVLNRVSREQLEKHYGNKNSR